MDKGLREYLSAIASEQCWEDNDDEEFVVDDYAGGNVDDAYGGGRRAGEILLARELLSIIGKA